MSFLDRIRECNNADVDRYRPFVVAGHRVGWVGETMAQHVAPFTDVFRVTVDAVALNPDLADFEGRSQAVDAVVRQLAEQGHLPPHRGEAYAVGTSFAAPALMKIDRSAVPLFGVRAYGIHVNGYVADGSGLAMWVARRSRGNPTFPGQLDNMVAGGQPIGVSLIDNLVKEAAEEAALPGELARRAIPVGAITYCAEIEGGVRPDVQFCYDLAMPADVVPRPDDDEIERFDLWPVDRVLEVVADTTEFKFNCNLVVIDFAVRHGLIPPDHPDYVEIVRGLRR